MNVRHDCDVFLRLFGRMFSAASTVVRVVPSFPSARWTEIIHLMTVDQLEGYVMMMMMMMMKQEEILLVS